MCAKETGAHLGSLQQGEWATSLAVEGLLVATGLFDCTVKLWNLKSFEGLRVLRGHRGPVMSVAFKDATLLASASFDRTARLWNVEERHKEMELGVWKESYNKDNDIIHV